MLSHEYAAAEQDGVRLPKVARIAGAFVSAVEAADHMNPVSIDNISDDGLSFHDVLSAELVSADAVYARHEKLFYPSGEIVDFNNLDLEAILENT